VFLSLRLFYFILFYFILFYFIYIISNYLHVGLSLCGAGAGGYAVVILKRGSVRSDLFTILTSFKPFSPPSSSSASSKNGSEARSSYDSTFSNNGLTISTVTVDTKGISTKELVENDDTSTSTSTSMPRIPHANTRRLADYLFL
jgi:hypothetical protein